MMMRWQIEPLVIHQKRDFDTFACPKIFDWNRKKRKKDFWAFWETRQISTGLSFFLFFSFGNFFGSLETFSDEGDDGSKKKCEKNVEAKSSEWSCMKGSLAILNWNTNWLAVLKGTKKYWILSGLCQTKITELNLLSFATRWENNNESLANNISYYHEMVISDKYLNRIVWEFVRRKIAGKTSGEWFDGFTRVSSIIFLV